VQHVSTGGGKAAPHSPPHPAEIVTSTGVDDDDEDEEEEEEEEEEGEDEDGVGDMTPGAIKARALMLMLGGVGLVTLFSDPMVDVLAALGGRLGVKSFYVSFVISPLVSNASELISSIIFASAWRD